MNGLDTLLAWRDVGRGVALATVVATWGSSPRPAGSQLVVADDGAFEGSVSGGCVEGAVIDAALRAIESGAHRLLDFGVTDEMAWEVGLACGGRMEVFVELVSSREDARSPLGAQLDQLAADRQAKRPAVWIADLASGAREILHPTEEPASGAGPLLEVARRALREDRCHELPPDPIRGAGRLFVQPVNPALRLAIVGAVHVAQPLAEMAAAIGYEVVVVDPRGSFASEARFPGVELSRSWPDEALTGLRLDPRTAVVTLTHDPKLDDPALDVALRSNAFYIGALGSRRTHASRLARLRARGFDDATLDRICGPVGLDIGARSAAEIAVSILAQITARLRQV